VENEPTNAELWDKLCKLEVEQWDKYRKFEEIINSQNKIISAQNKRIAELEEKNTKHETEIKHQRNYIDSQNKIYLHKIKE